MGDYFLFFVFCLLESTQTEFTQSLNTVGPTHNPPISMLPRSRIKRPEHAAKLCCKTYFLNIHAKKITQKQLHTSLCFIVIMFIVNICLKNQIKKTIKR